MKIKVNDEIAVGVQLVQKQVCPAGTAYWNIDYMYNGICIHTATTGAIYGNPNPIAMLDREFTVSEYHYQDIETPDPRPEPRPKNYKEGTASSRPCWWIEIAKTHRQAIIESVAQIVD